MYKLNPALKDFWRTRKTYKLLKGGRFSSKTEDAAGMAAFLARNYSVKFLCLRQFQNRIADSVYTVVKQKIEAAGWSDEFDIGVSTIRHKKTGSEFLFYGIARNIEEIKGIHGVNICWIEEGEGLTEQQWSIIDPTIRADGSEVWIVWNPGLITDFVQAKLPAMLGDDCIIRHINYDENPFLSKTARDKALRRKAVDPEGYRHVYLGEPLSDEESAIIKRRWVMAAVGAFGKLGIEPTGAKRIGYDVADDGVDTNAMVKSHGGSVYGLEEWRGGEDKLMQSCSKAFLEAVRTGSEIIYDPIGVGASCGSKFKELNETRQAAVTYSKFNAGGAIANPNQDYADGIKNKDMFANLKAQAWWVVADMFRNTYNAINGQPFDADNLISIDPNLPHLERLITELSTPRREYDPHGRVKVESKKDLVKRGVASPNLADALIMIYAPRSKKLDIMMEAL